MVCRTKVAVSFNRTFFDLQPLPYSYLIILEGSNVKNQITEFVKRAGSYAQAGRICGVSYQTIQQWEVKKDFPAGEYNGTKQYRKKIKKALKWEPKLRRG